MKITRENYESYFLDYMEGSLDPALMEEMRTFLSRNSDLKAELDEFELVHLYADPINFTEKEQLKKSDISSTIFQDQDFDQMCIARMEGDLDHLQDQALENYLKDSPRKRKELELFYKTRLQPSLVLFPDKDLLKRKSPAIWRKYSWYSISAAASIILIVLFSLILDTLRLPDEEQIAEIPQETDELETNIADGIAENENTISNTPIEVSEKINQQEPNVIIVERTTDFIAQMNTAKNTQSEDPLSVNQKMATGDRITNMKFLTRREFEQISITPYGTLTALKTVNQEPGAIDEYLTLRELMAQRLRRNVLPDNPETPENTNKLKFLDVADAGVRGISRLPGVNMQLNRNYDEGGELASYAFTSRNLSFSREVKK